MTRPLSALGLLALLSPLGCGDKNGDDSAATGAGGDTAAESDADTDSDSDSDTDSDPVGDMEPGDQVFVATFSHTTWTATGGYWTSNTIQGDDPDSEVEFQIVISDDPRDSDSVTVTELLWVDTVHNGYDFYYKASTSDLSFTIEGRDPDGDYVWGSLEGPIEMTDIESGDVIELESVTVESWPKFGT